MKKITLLSLTIRNFKGIKDFLFNTNGGNADAYGDNGTGKTTVPDSFLWLLFGKDTNNRSDFSIKTLDSEGRPINGLEHEVEGVFDIDKRTVTLKRIYKEVWTKPRNQPVAVFGGHTTDYFIDGVPTKKRDYDEFISNMIEEDVFKLITNPAYFNEQLKKDERRKVLMGVCGDVTDEEVISSNDKLVELPDILSGRSIEDHKKVIASKLSAIKKELDAIPTRISEVDRGMPDIGGLDKDGLQAKISVVNTRIDAKQDQISSIRNGNAITEKQKQIQEVEIELMRIKSAHESGSQDEVYKLKARLQEEQSNVTIFNRDLQSIEQQKKHNNERIKSIESKLAELRGIWKEVNAVEFTHNDECECPTCGQALPNDQVQAARDKALEEFNLKRSNRLEGLDAEGNQESERKKKLEQENVGLDKETEKVNERIADKQKLIKKLQEQLSKLENMVVDITENAEYVAKLTEKQQLSTELEGIRSSADQEIQSIQLKIVELRAERDQLQEDLSKFAFVKQAQDRIDELKGQERKLAKEYEELQRQLFLTEEFTRTKVEFLEDKINSKFKYARFRLFEEQVNGGLREDCTTTFDGVPYDSGLNNAAKINVGLDIINTLSEHYGFYAPIFVDNAEAVTQLIDTEAQLIRLIVSEQDKQLRVETKTSDESVVA
ncbi:hypothetical protein BEP19_09970 [Ammoniphilus oxalaticus]|uniref:Nuclease SbcCD subunit C n=1 Tax=Ammoniphilus oxalaticus TaxID=66863 RepID=A0A419SFM0_9BACL|nr:hypothetical protein [Ammoniphilus oxalaticus]RKD22578.1 hypothetical protein BEP19_09970 [Ammoniphilus oxalaticus]